MIRVSGVVGFGMRSLEVFGRGVIDGSLGKGVLVGAISVDVSFEDTVLP